MGAQVLFRHNFCDGFAPIGGHGYDSSPTAIRTWEIYDNIFTNWIGANGMIWRGGSGVIFSNQLWGNMNEIANLLYYRATAASFPGQHTRSGFLTLGVPGQGYMINFQGVQAQSGIDQCFTNQPMDQEYMVLGHTFYYFVNNLNETGYQMVNHNTYGGCTVLIGPTVAQTITNFFNAVNVVPKAYGISWTNYNGSPANLIGYDFIATGYDANNLYLTNALDCNTNSFGYPAFDQPGVIGEKWLIATSTNFVQTAVKWPAYCWGNTMNGVENNSLVIGSPGTYMTNLVALGRDYFTDTAPNPAVYTPLVYPHPLQVLEAATQSNATGSPPSNLRAFKLP